MSEQQEQVRCLLDECARLRQENTELRAILAEHGLDPKPVPKGPQPAPVERGAVTSASPTGRKVGIVQKPVSRPRGRVGLSAFTFKQVLKEIKARYVLGLTATPTRKDGHHPIVFVHGGPIRFHLTAR